MQFHFYRRILQNKQPLTAVRHDLTHVGVLSGKWSQRLTLNLLLRCISEEQNKWIRQTVSFCAVGFIAATISGSWNVWTIIEGHVL